uniref:Uncharacterized protein n=1 Tax=Setaria italica TaxID=4555 RepID=K3YMM2_SETIT
MEDMLRHIEPEVLLGSAKGLENFETLKKAANDRMYVGCGKEWTVLRFVLHLLILKTKFGWSNNSFNDLLTLLGNFLPKPNFVPKNTYEEKKIINPMKMHVQRTHACRNHCILYHGEYAALEKCPNCDASLVKGKTSCVVCLDGASYVYLKGSTKIVFMRHRRFLLKMHIPQDEGLFYGTNENDFAQNQLRSETTNVADMPFKEMSIFFKYLPYWQELAVRHAIDGMHLQKNVFDSTIGFLGLSGKAKDGLKSRKDLVDLQIRPELHPQELLNGKYYLPSASYNLIPDERLAICAGGRHLCWLKVAS